MQATATQYTTEYFINALRSVDPEAVREAYRKLSRQVHPDLNPDLGQEPMKALNNAYDVVMKGWDGKTYKRPTGKGSETKDATYNYDEAFERIVRDIITWAQTNPYTEHQEIVGMWMWVSGSFPTGTASNGLGFNTKAEAYDHIIQSIKRDCGHDNPTIWWNDVTWEPEPNPVVRPQFLWQGQYYDKPTVEELEEWISDCGCETPAGDWTEPDDPDSWLSLLGLI